MNATLNISDYINNQNENIWNEIKDKYVFNFTYNPFETSWMSKAENGIANIVANSKDINYSSFTHELLHIYLDYLGMSEMPELIYSIQGENSFMILIENSLVPFIYNVCSHRKMFPFYKEMGFSEYKFVQERIDFTVSDLTLIKNGFENNQSKLIPVNQFIGHSFALLNNVVEEDKIKCANFLNDLKNIQPELFGIIQQFDKNWNDSLDLNLTSIFIEFESELENWLISKNLIFENDYCW